VQGGALNAALLAKYAKGDELSAVTEMQDFWKSAANTTLYKNWRGGIIDGLIFKGGLYDSSPLESFLKKRFPEPFPEDSRAITVGLVDVLTGEYKDFTEKDF